MWRAKYVGDVGLDRPQRLVVGGVGGERRPVHRLAASGRVDETRVSVSRLGTRALPPRSPKLTRSRRASARSRGCARCWRRAARPGTRSAGSAPASPCSRRTRPPASRRRRAAAARSRAPVSAANAASRADVRVARRLGAAHRRAIGIAGAVHVAARRHDAEVRRAPAGARPGRAERRDAHPDRVRRASAGSSVERAGEARRVDHDVGALRGARSSAGSSGPSTTTERLPGAPRGEPVADPAQRMPAGRLGEHDLGAEVGEDPAGHRARARRRGRRPARRASSPRRQAGLHLGPRLFLTSVSAYLGFWPPSARSGREASACPRPRIVDADCHILEPPDIWTNWLPEKYADKAPKLVKDAAGRRRVADRGRRRARPDRARLHAGDAVRRVPLVRRHLRGGAHRLLQRRGPPRGHGHRRRATPSCSTRRSAR